MEDMMGGITFSPFDVPSLKYMLTEFRLVCPMSYLYKMDMFSEIKETFS